MTPTLETLARIDTGERSLRVERSTFVSVHGPRTVLLISTYRQVRGGRWHREKSVSVRRSELLELAGKLEQLAR